MAVKSSSTGVRLLNVLDAVARKQPIGVSELARTLEDDKSAVQRMLVTLSEGGWIKAEGGRSAVWTVTNRLRLLADIACTGVDMRLRARDTLERLRDSSGETVSLVTRDADRLIVIDVAESRETLRVAPRVGEVVPGPRSASMLVYLSCMTGEDQRAFFGEEIDADLRVQIDRAAESGFVCKETGANGISVTVAAPIRGDWGQPLGAIVLSAPTVRAPGPVREELAKAVAEAAKALSA